MGAVEPRAAASIAGPAEQPPRVSVIVPVRNRRDLLARLLVALDQQDYTSFEVIVVDDGSTDGSDELAAKALVHGAPVHLIRQQGAGAVAARVRAIADSQGAILAFTDSDCEPQPAWLTASVAAVDEGADLVHGPTVPARPVGPLERSVNERNGALFPTANVVVRREAFERVGGFDQAASTRWRFRANARAKGLGFGEDTLLGWKVTRTGTVAFAPDAEVRHYVFGADLTEFVSRGLQVGAFPALLREIPELADFELIRRGFLFSHRSRVPMYATVAALATRRPPLVAASFGWWAVHRFRHTLRTAPIPWRRRVSALPVQMLLDVLHGGALITGSVRARRLLL